MSPLRDSFSHLSEPPSTVGSTQASTRKRSLSAKKPKGDYEVGYGRPPEATRFKKGKSGNPRGRPPKNSGKTADVDIRQCVRDTFLAPLQVRLNGEATQMTALKAILLGLQAKAATADLGAIKLLVEIGKQTGVFLPHKDPADQQGGVLLVREPAKTAEEWTLRYGSSVKEHQERCRKDWEEKQGTVADRAASGGAANGGSSG